MIYPSPLKRGDLIAILSPATIVKREYIEKAARALERAGFRVRVMQAAHGPASGTFAASHEERFADLRNAFADPEVKAIFCARGGYGAIHLISRLEPEFLRRNPKWVIGFSDISALHAMMHRAGIASLHAPMAKHIALLGLEDVASKYLLELLTNDKELIYTVAGDARNLHGEAEGELRGGNLAVLNGLADTPFDILHIDENERVILFIEDISEKIYAVERMLMRLILGGNIGRLAGLIVGQFTDYAPDRNHSSMEAMISDLLARHGISLPTAFNFPVGHVDYNLPLLEGGHARLVVTKEEVTLKINKL